MTVASNSNDNELQHRVRTELEWDPRVDAPLITVSVKAGIVTLGGVVDSFAKKAAALKAVHQIKGVLDVADDVRVQPGQTKSDEEIARAVRAALIWDASVPDEQITSTVSGGWVTLAGNVERIQQRDDAIQSVERLTGIRGVINEIRVLPPPVATLEIRAAIEDALTRRARREAWRIGIAVADGTVTLSGRVDSWAEKNAVGQLVRNAGGVKHIVNNLMIDPYS